MTLSICRFLLQNEIETKSHFINMSLKPYQLLSQATCETKKIYIEVVQNIYRSNPKYI